MPEGGAEAGALGAAAGCSVSTSVARLSADSPVGRNKGPFWPQAASVATMAAPRTSLRARALTRIWVTVNIIKL